MKSLRAGFESGTLTPVQAKYFASKAVEEFYDTQSDPHEISNLIGSKVPEHGAALARLREAHLKWSAETRDLGFLPEAEVALRERELGSRHAIMLQPRAEKWAARLREYASEDLASKPVPDDPIAVAWWLLRLSPELLKEHEPRIEALVDHKVAHVRIATAEALWRLGNSKDAVAIATRELSNESPWIKLQAVILLDEIGSDARSALPELKKLLKPKGIAKDSASYAARVAEHFVKKHRRSKP
jgi:hypothetical protein